ncbi:MAG: hypothetical protein ABI445_24160 [Polyangia bacterium]
MRARGYLWERLEDELEAMFHTTHALDPARSMGSSADVESWVGWKVEDLPTGPRMARPKPPPVSRAPAKGARVSLIEYRAAHRAAGLCIDCDAPRHEKSKSYCVRHREEDRVRAAKKRIAKKEIT